MSGRSRVDTTRASRDGHEFHEAWSARYALRLLNPREELVGVAMEGLHPADQKSARSETVEVADVTLYYDGAPTFAESNRLRITQFKYSISDEEKEFRATNAKKTIEKFAKTFSDYKKRYGTQITLHKLEFELITNRPIFEPLHDAISALARGDDCAGAAKKQMIQFRAAAGLSGVALRQFAQRCKITGLAGSLSSIQSELESDVVDWSATRDPIARARLGNLRKLVRDKAGHAGTEQNVILRTDILAALEISDVDELLPCPDALPDVGEVVLREQLDEALGIVENSSVPLLVHATGGVGKTVFLESIARSLGKRHEVVLFDCFGGGRYRAPEDARHLPRNGLVHIVNTLSFRGLCDPIIPGGQSPEGLVRAFRRRVKQCIDALTHADDKSLLVLVLDAIDNAVGHAADRHEDAFPLLLLNSLHQEPISRLKVVLSSRTERKPEFDAELVSLKLRPFSQAESEEYLNARIPDVTPAQVKVARARSRGNPRVLEYLLGSDQCFLDRSSPTRKVRLDDLIEARITSALSEAKKRGCCQDDIDTFLAALGVLPPPVPLEELAGAHGIEASAVESFASDLIPLLEITSHGLMFRDEPTETLVRTRYSGRRISLRRLARSLLARQDSSVYAARALPNLLHKLGDTKRLFELAFDERIPAAITSAVGRREVRYARLKAAALQASIKSDHNRLLQLLVELSTMAAGDERGDNYILDNPDLVVAAQDVDATRRLFELRTAWPGSRHSRLVIAHSLAGDSNEANRHAATAIEWIEHYLRSDKDEFTDSPSPEELDLAAIPFFLLCENRSAEAATYMQTWRDWYAYQLCKRVYILCGLGTIHRAALEKELQRFVIQSQESLGCLAATLAHGNLHARTRRKQVILLAKRCRGKRSSPRGEPFRGDRGEPFNDGLRKSAAIAVSLGLNAEARAISRRAEYRRPTIWGWQDRYYSREAFGFVFEVALVSASRNKTVHEKDVLPTELVPVCSGLRRTLSGSQFRAKAKERICEFARRSNDEESGQVFGSDSKDHSDRFLDRTLEPLLGLTQGLARVLSSTKRGFKGAFRQLLEAWRNARKSHYYYHVGPVDWFFDELGFRIVRFVVWAREDVDAALAREVLECLHENEHTSASSVVSIIEVLARRPQLQSIAGEQCAKATSKIEKEDEVVSRAKLYSRLSRAIAPASGEDAALFFREGLEQLDTIGSGDYEFVNELFILASHLKGNELQEQDFHTLTNFCELNLSYEAEKFPWVAFAQGMSKTSGLRGLAKLARWDDRSKVGLSYTLQPYLSALVHDGKLSASFAVALNWLTRPVHLYGFGPEQFAKFVCGSCDKIGSEEFRELVRQFEANRPGVSDSESYTAIAKLGEKIAGVTVPSERLNTVAKRFMELGRRRRDDPRISVASRKSHRGKLEKELDAHRVRLRKLANETDPFDVRAVEQALDSNLGQWHNRELKAYFFQSLRKRIQYGDRGRFMTVVSSLESLDIYDKLSELNACRVAWQESTPSLKKRFKTLGSPLVRAYSEEVVQSDRLSAHQLRKISDATGVAVQELITELATLFAKPDTFVSGAVWLSMASMLCEVASPGVGQLALQRLLRGESNKLADGVEDGPWKEGLYPVAGATAVASGLIWRNLGAPEVATRWRAAHSIRCFGRFGIWDVIDELMKKLESTDAGPFQAGEIPFYYMHARVWLLMAVVRLALDYPEQVARYKRRLLPIALGRSGMHWLQRHLAASAILTCNRAGELKLSTQLRNHLEHVDLAKLPRVSKKLKKGNDFYSGRPSNAPQKTYDLSFEYDFEKHEVQDLSCVFGMAGWEVKDMVADVVKNYDCDIDSMHDTGGRQNPGIDKYKTGTLYHTYGFQAVWHALLEVTGKLMETRPVTDDSWVEDDPLRYWQSQFILTRKDGQWLSDGTDPVPVDSVVSLLEGGPEDTAITGDKEKLLEIVGLNRRAWKNLVVYGVWPSTDGVGIAVTSALVARSKATTLARELMRGDPYFVWLPNFTKHEGEDEYVRHDHEQGEFKPWIVVRDSYARIDEYDPLGTIRADNRPYISAKYSAPLKISPEDPFGRVWANSRGHVAARTEAWLDIGEEDDYEKGGGVRLQCSRWAIRRILAKSNMDLVIAIKLQRYHKDSQIDGSSFSNTVAAIRVRKSLEFQFFKGPINFRRGDD